MKEYEKQTQEIYSKMNYIWPVENSWYDYTHSQIIEFIYKNKKVFKKNGKILNAGSGGSEYDIDGDMYHVDLATNLIKHLPNSFTASIEAMPFSNNYFDSVICVGSVVNYCDALTAISEIARVIQSGGYLIIEYERSLTGELFLKRGYGKNAIKQIYTFNNESNHNLWLYSDKYINRILQENGFEILDTKLFHSLSAIKNRFLNNEIKSGYASRYDKYIPKWLSYRFAHNRIILCKKLF